MKGDLHSKITFTSEENPNYSGSGKDSSFELTLRIENENADYMTYLRKAEEFIRHEIIRLKRAAPKGKAGEVEE